MKIFQGFQFAFPLNKFHIIQTATSHVQAVLTAVKKLGVAGLISSRPCQQRDIIVAAIIARICESDSKLAMTRWWKNTTVPELLNLHNVDEDEVYEAMDWLLGRQKRIEKKLAKRHLKENDPVPS